VSKVPRSCQLNTCVATLQKIAIFPKNHSMPAFLEKTSPTFIRDRQNIQYCHDFTKICWRVKLLISSGTARTKTALRIPLGINKLICCFEGIIFEPETLEIRSRALQTRIIV